MPPLAQSAEAKVYFYFVKCMGAKTPQQKHLWKCNKKFYVHSSVKNC